MNKWFPKVGAKVLVRWVKRAHNPREAKWEWRTGVIRSMKGGYNKALDEELYYYKIEFIPNTGNLVEVSSREIPDRLIPYSRMADVLYADNKLDNNKK